MIEKSTFYKFIYVSVSFQNNANFIQSLKNNFKMEIPYCDLKELTPELKESLDSYFYIEDTPEFIGAFKKLCSKYPKVSFTVLGRIRGKDIFSFFNICKEENVVTFKTGDNIRLISGEFKGLIAKVSSVEGENAIIEYPLLKEKKLKTVPLNSINKHSADYSDLVVNQFKNLEKQYVKNGVFRTLLVDGNDCLHRCIKNNNVKYNGNRIFIGGVFGFYFNLLKLKEIYPEYEIQVFFEEESLQKRSEIYQAAFRQNLSWCIRLLDNIGFQYYTGSILNGIYTVLEKSKAEYEKVLIFSSNPLLQTLVSDSCTLLYPKMTFRGSSIYLTPESVRKQWEISDPEKILWSMSLVGDFENIRNYTQFSQNAKVKKQDYLPALSTSNTFHEFKQELMKQDKFLNFILSGTMDENFKNLQFSRIPLKKEKGKPNETKMIKFLEELQMYKEVELIDRSMRIFKGMW